MLARNSMQPRGSAHGRICISSGAAQTDLLKQFRANRRPTRIRPTKGDRPEKPKIVRLIERGGTREQWVPVKLMPANDVGD